MFNNNIYDRIKGVIFSFETMYGKKPNVIKIGRGNYNRLRAFVSEHNLDSSLLNEIDGCIFDIKESFDDFLVADRIGDSDVRHKQIDKDKEKFLRWLMNGNGLWKAKVKADSLSDEIDEDLKYMCNELAFERWLKDNNRL